LLEVDDLRAGYEGADVVRGVSLSVKPGEVLSLIGANGAGKSTLLRAMSGLVRPSGGSVSVDGHRLSFRSEREVVRSGVAHVPEGRQVFTNLSVAENLRLGAYSTAKRGDVAGLIDDMVTLFPDLGPRLGAYAGSLSGGQQQMLAIARGLMSAPRYLLLDEPSLGLAPLVVAKIFTVVVELRRRRVGILLVEQNGRLALSNADQGYLLEQGRVTLSGTGQELLDNPTVIERYLGVGSSIGDTDQQRQLASRLRSALLL
jgi:branched-chain amino acid transport system ATP-binding protein